MLGKKTYEVLHHFRIQTLEEDLLFQTLRRVESRDTQTISWIVWSVICDHVCVEQYPADFSDWTTFNVAWSVKTGWFDEVDCYNWARDHFQQHGRSQACRQLHPLWESNPVSWVAPNFPSETRSTKRQGWIGRIIHGREICRINIPSVITGGCRYPGSEASRVASLLGSWHPIRSEALQVL